MSDRRRSLHGRPGGRELSPDSVPELELVIGPQPDVPRLGPVEAQRRFEVVFQDFFRAFAHAEHPLVMFLDDLQWADAALLRLLHLLLTAPGAGHLLVLGAFRDNEVEVLGDSVAWLKAPRAGSVQWSHAIRHYRTARGHTRFAVDHRGFPAGQMGPTRVLVQCQRRVAPIS